MNAHDRNEIMHALHMLNRYAERVSKLFTDSDTDCNEFIDKYPENWGSFDEEALKIEGFVKATNKKLETFPVTEKKPERMFLNHYECPKCGYLWDDEWDCQVDDDCPACGTRHISPFSTEDLITGKVEEC